MIVISIIYVDDALFCSPNKAVVDSIKAQFMCKWECRDLGEPKEFLRMHITHKGCAIHLDQCAYLQKVIERCGMLNAKAASTPLPAGYYALANKDPVNPELCSQFQTVIGSLLYLMLGTRPNIAFAVTHLSRHSTNPSQDHLNKALYICQYLIGTSSYSLVYNGGSSSSLMACTDPNWGSDPTSCLSQTGFYLKLADGLISWTSCAQKTIAYSSTEAEYMALSDCAHQVTWICSLLGELGYKLKAIPICGDNQGSIFMASCYDQFSSPVGRRNRDSLEVGGILTTAHREFSGCAHRCVGKPKHREQDRASPRRRGHAQLGTAEG